MSEIMGFTMTGKGEMTMQVKKIELPWEMYRNMSVDCLEQMGRPWYPGSSDPRDQTCCPAIPIHREQIVVASASEEDYL
jgi:hypothetical protein